MPTVLQRRPRQVVDEEEEVVHRPRQRQRRDESDDDAESNASVEGDSELPGATQRDESNEAQLIKKLVRYALACEYSRTPMRRDGIRDRVLGTHGRLFRRVFDGAQKQLRAVFGMEMVQLPTRDKDTMSLGEKRKAAKTDKRGATTSNAFILVTRLAPEFRTADIIAPSRVQSADDEAAYIGVYTTIIAVITLNGGNLSDAKLRRYLTRLNAADNVTGDKTDVVLTKLQRQGYIVRTSEKKSTDGEEIISWSVGPRAKREVGNEAIAGLVREVYGNATEDLENRIQASLKIQAQNGAAEEAEDGPAVGEDSIMTNGNGEGSSRANGTRRRSRRHGDDDDDE